MVVKGSQQYRSVVIPYRPLRQVVLTLGLLAAFIAAGFGSYHYGYTKAQSNYRQAMEEWNQLHELTNQQAQQLQQLNQQVANTQLGSNVDKQTVEQLKQQIVTLNEQITSLQESNNFYRQLMDQPEKNKGLTIGSFKVEAMDQPQHFRYELVIQQLTTEHRLSEGKINITVTGNVGENTRSYSITELSDKPGKMDIPLKLRFYQTITGNVVLPEGFVAKKVDVSAQKNGAAVVTASFDWVVKP
jgi:hypothetical protein